MQQLLNALKTQSAALDQLGGHPRFGIVSSFDAKTYTARVQFQPENVLSGWLPVLASWGGSGWGLLCPPTPGQQVLVVAQEGDTEHGVILGTAFSQASAPPQAPAGEWWLVHQKGSYLKLLNDGSIVASATGFSLAGDVAVTGNLKVSGDISDANGAHGTLASLRNAYDQHTHQQSGGGTTSIPSTTV